jgi:hypothetical protein
MCLTRVSVSLPEKIQETNPTEESKRSQKMKNLQMKASLPDSALRFTVNLSELLFGGATCKATSVAFGLPFAVRKW